MLTVSDARRRAWGGRRSSAARASRGPREAARRLLLLLLQPRLHPQGPGGGGSRAPRVRAPVPGRVTAASRPTSSAPIGCRPSLQRGAAASGPGWGGAAAAPSRAGKGAVAAAAAGPRSPPRSGICRHVPHVGSRREGGRLARARRVAGGGAARLGRDERPPRRASGRPGRPPSRGNEGSPPEAPRMGRRRRRAQKWACGASWAWAGGSERPRPRGPRRRPLLRPAPPAPRGRAPSPSGVLPSVHHSERRLPGLICGRRICVAKSRATPPQRPPRSPWSPRVCRGLTPRPGRSTPHPRLPLPLAPRGSRPSGLSEVPPSSLPQRK